ncbi:mitochondrial carrier [Rhodotorula sp. JG-1b]|nr:mitochondrial carrier [Rhodotorula sp. JG-1b]
MAPSKTAQLEPVNLLIGSAVSVFEVTTLGQPFEVLKTHMAANRQDSLRTAIRKTTERGGLKGFYQGLIPWAWIESSTAGAVLLFTSSYVEDFATHHANMSRGAAGLLGGAIGGAAQAYLAMGVCTRMKTAEITRNKTLAKVAKGVAPPTAAANLPASTFGLFMEIWRKDGIRGINKGVNAVALRQATNWSSRIGIARAAEQTIKELGHKKPGEPLTPAEKVTASAIGGALGCWNHPLEVIRVEMQSLSSTSPSIATSGIISSTSNVQAPTILSTARYIYRENGIRGLFRGVTPRVALGVWRTVCLVSLGDHVKSIVKKDVAASGPD